MSPISRSLLPNPNRSLCELPRVRWLARCILGANPFYDRCLLGFCELPSLFLGYFVKFLTLQAPEQGLVWNLEVLRYSGDVTFFFFGGPGRFDRVAAFC